MDNNFDENKQGSDNVFSEEDFSGNASAEPVSPQQKSNAFSENIQGTSGMQMNEGGQSVPQQPAQGIPNTQGIPNAQRFSDMQAAMNGGFPQYPQYAPAQGAVYPFPETPKKKRLSAGWIWALCILIAVFLGIIVILSAMISSQVENIRDIREKEMESDISFSAENEPQERIVINLPVSRKPVLEEELYQNQETGLLTTVGVAQMILPSQVKVEIFGDMPYISVGSGSGIIISSDGYIVTNAHVVDGAGSISVKFYDGSSEEASVIGIDKKSDLAVIKVDRDDLAAAELGTSSDLVIGEEIAAAGAGGGYENTVTYGYVTGLNREISTDYMSSSIVHCIQTDAALNFGNSGGAIVNMYGQVVGVIVAHMPNENFENIGFSIAIDDAVPIIEELIANGYVSSRSRVGIYYLAIGDSTANSYEVIPGLCVTGIDPESHASDAGIMLYDIITQIDGVRVFGGSEVAEALSGKVPGDTVRLTVFRKSVTGENSIFETSLQLVPDTASVSADSDSITSEEFYSREVIQ